MSEDLAATVQLAHAALTAGVDDDWPTAVKFLLRISNEFGPGGVQIALQVWCDALMRHATGGVQSTGPLQIGHVDHNTGALGGTGVPARTLWAGRLFEARAAMDREAFTALLHEIPDDPDAGSSYVTAPLESAALSIRSYPYGYALMGRN